MGLFLSHLGRNLTRALREKLAESLEKLLTARNDLHLNAEEKITFSAEIQKQSLFGEGLCKV